MGVLDYLNRWKYKDISYKKGEHDNDQSFSKVGTLEIPDRLKDNNAFILANTVSEIFYPIDFLADRASKLRFYIADKDGFEVPNTELNRFIQSINPLYSFSDLVYQYIVSLNADGNAYLLKRSIDNIKFTVDNITRLDVLQPNLVELQEYRNINLVNVSSRIDIVKRLVYDTKEYELNGITINTIDSRLREDSSVLSKSPLFKAYRNVNNLLAVYSARWNSYANNGAVGYLVHDKSSSNSIADAIGSSTTRQEILDDINDRNGITGRRNFWGISSIPLKFINTLGIIKDLLPFDETLEDSIKIGSIYQLPAGLVSRKDQSTYDNKDTDERSVWENTLTSMVETTLLSLTKEFALNKIGYSIKADYSSVSVLSDNELTKEDVRTKKIDNLTKLNTLKSQSVDPEITKEIDKIIKEYGN